MLWLCVVGRDQLLSWPVNFVSFFQEGVRTYLLDAVFGLGLTSSLFRFNLNFVFNFVS